MLLRISDDDGVETREMKLLITKLMLITRKTDINGDTSSQERGSKRLICSSRLPGTQQSRSHGHPTNPATRFNSIAGDRQLDSFAIWRGVALAWPLLPAMPRFAST